MTYNFCSKLTTSANNEAVIARQTAWQQQQQKQTGQHYIDSSRQLTTLPSNFTFNYVMIKLFN